jgi:hypothetical protein
MKGYDHIPRCGLYEKTCLLEKESTVNGNADGICRGGNERMGDGNSWSGITDPMDASQSGTGTKSPLLDTTHLDHNSVPRRRAVVLAGPHGSPLQFLTGLSLDLVNKKSDMRKSS